MRLFPLRPQIDLREVFESAGIGVRSVEHNFLLGKGRIEFVPVLDPAVRLPQLLELTDGQRIAPRILGFTTTEMPSIPIGNSR